MRKRNLSVALILMITLSAGCASITKGMFAVLSEEHDLRLKHLDAEIKEYSSADRDNDEHSPSAAVSGISPYFGLFDKRASKTIENSAKGSAGVLDHEDSSDSNDRHRLHAEEPILADPEHSEAIEKGTLDTVNSENAGLNRQPTNQSNATEASPDSTKLFEDRIKEFLDTLKDAAYAFNPPSPITVAKPTTIYFLLEPQGDAVKLADRLRELAPKDTSRIVHGETKWASVMEASLSGSDFEVEPSDPVKKTLNSSERAMWKWVITPKHPGEKLPLTLTVKAILPNDFAPPHEVILLQREIDVQVTTWWLFDHYFDKYWKWLLGGVAGLVTATFGWWWKERWTAPNPALKRKPRKWRRLA